MKKEIENLVVEKSFYNKLEDVSKKQLFAFIELGEASDNWKKGRSEEEIAEELIDVTFYLLDASRLACPSVNMDEMFMRVMLHESTICMLWECTSQPPSRSITQEIET